MTDHRSALLLILLAIVPALPAQSPAETKLAEYRKKIDTLDRQIVALLNRRADVVHRVGVLKKEAGLPIAAPAREQQVLEKAVEAGKGGPLPAEVLRRIYTHLLQEMRTWEASVAGSEK